MKPASDANGACDDTAAWAPPGGRVPLRMADNPSLAQLARETAALGLVDGYTAAAGCMTDWEEMPYPP